MLKCFNTITLYLLAADFLCKGCNFLKIFSFCRSGNTFSYSPFEAQVYQQAPFR